MVTTTREAKQKVAETNRILFMEGLADNVGHVSIRDPDEEIIHINPRTASRGEIRPNDVVEVTLESEPVDSAAPEPVSEREIHTALYREREDINAVLHLHPPLMTLFSISGTDLVPVYFRAAFLEEGKVPVLDYPDKITKREESDRMLKAMDGQNQVLMRGHGAVIADETIQHALARAMFLETNAYYQLYASILGNPNPLTQEEIERNRDGVWQDSSIEKVWHFYQWKAEENGFLPNEW